MIEAELADGTVLEFPDGTDPAVIDRVVKQQVTGSAPSPKAQDTKALREQGKVDARGMVSSIAAGFNKGILDLADLPFDVLNMAIDTVGGLTDTELPRTATPTQAIDYLSEKLTGFRPIEAATTPTDAVDTATERMAFRAAEFGGGGGVGTKLVKEGAQRAAQRQGTTPVGTRSQSIAKDTGLVGRETVASTGAGIGMGATEEFTDNAGVQLAGAVIGGFTPGGIKAGAKAVGDPFKGFTKSSAEKRVGNILVDNAEDPGQAIQNLQTNPLVVQSSLPGTKITAASAADDPGVLRTIESAAANNSHLLSVLRRSNREGVDAVNTSIRELSAKGSPSEFVARFNGLTVNAIEGLRNEIDLAKNLHDKLELSLESRPTSQISEEFVDSLEASYNRAKTTERTLWEAVDRSEAMPAGEFRAQVGKLYKRLKQEGVALGSFPEGLFREAGTFGQEGPRTFGALQNYRSAVLDAIREANKNNQSQTARALSSLEEEIRNFMGKAGTSEAQQAAAQFTRTLHDNYNRGKLGKLLNVDSQGDLRIDPEVALTKVVRPGDNIGDVRRAVANEVEQTLPSGETFPAAQGLTERLQEYLRAKFAVADTPRARAAFLKQYKPTLDEFPTLARNLRAIDKEINTVAEQIAEREGRIATITDKNRSATAALLGVDPEDAFSRLKKLSKDDLSNINQIAVREGIQDGLQSIYMREIARQFIRQDGSVRGRLGSVLSDTDLAKGYSIVLTPVQRKSLQGLQKAGNLFDQVDPGRARDLGSLFEANPLTQIVARLIGVRAASVAAPSGPSALQAAAIFSRAAQQVINKLPSSQAEAVLEHALVDPAYMAKLMKKSLKGDEEQIRNTLKLWFSEAGVTVDDDMFEEE